MNKSFGTKIPSQASIFGDRQTNASLFDKVPIATGSLFMNQQGPTTSKGSLFSNPSSLYDSEFLKDIKQRSPLFGHQPPNTERYQTQPSPFSNTFREFQPEESASTASKFVVPPALNVLKQDLTITEAKLKQLLKIKKPSTFKQDFYEGDPAKFALAKEYFGCFVCKDIPIELKQCRSCAHIICDMCVKNQCPQCNSFEKLVPAFGKWLDLIKNLRTSHECSIRFKNQIPDENLEKKFLKLNISDLDAHMKKDCPISKTCFDCEVTFGTVEQYEGHLMYDCDHVIINCQTCQKEYTRMQFKLPPHDCYTQSLHNTRKL